MNVLFKNIPIGTQDYELAEFIESNSHLNSVGNGEGSVKVGGIQMLEREDGFTHPIEQFGIVRIYSTDVALKVIEQLNGTTFNGYDISVREYSIREDSNDPRIKNFDFSEDFIEHRMNDRRVHNLIYSRLI